MGRERDQDRLILDWDFSSRAQNNSSINFFSIFFQKTGNEDRSLEMETWHDLANVYTSLSQWHDAEVCLSKSKAINTYSASRWHATGTILLYLRILLILFYRQ